MNTAQNAERTPNPCLSVARRPHPTPPLQHPRTRTIHTLHTLHIITITKTRAKHHEYQQIPTNLTRILSIPTKQLQTPPKCPQKAEIIPCFPAPTVPLGLGLERLHLRGHLFIHLLPHSARILDLALETSILHILRAFSSPTTDHLFFAENANPCARQARQQPIHRPVAASVPCAVTAMSPMRWER